VSLRDKIAIIGAGCTKFGENFETSYGEMAAQASMEALEEAGARRQDVDAAWLGTAFPDAGVYRGRSGMDLAEALALFDVPITRVSNYCATGGDAFRNACNSLVAGESDLVLVTGVEKLRDRPPQDSLVAMMAETGHPLFQKGFTAAGTFAVVANRYFHTYGAAHEDIARISVKNHRHSVLNPKAHHTRELTLEAVLNSPMVADPLTLFECCPVTDGASAVVAVRKEDASDYTDDYVLLKGIGLSVSTGWDLPFFDPSTDFLGFKATRRAAETAYKQAGIEHPLKELDMAEVHDCFSITEFVTYEDLGLCARGGAKTLVDDEVTTRDGDLPVNVSGGLLSCGHPVGATGVRMLYEITRHLLGKAGERQLPDAEVGLAHNIGGPGAVASITILGAR
jgi:acetyl-CoA C-acetyltransferase